MNKWMCDQYMTQQLLWFVVIVIVVVWPTKTKQAKKKKKQKKNDNKYNRKPILLITCFTRMLNISHLLRYIACARLLERVHRTDLVKYIYLLPQRHIQRIHSAHIYRAVSYITQYGKRRCKYATNARIAHPAQSSSSAYSSFRLLKQIKITDTYTEW